MRLIWFCVALVVASLVIAGERASAAVFSSGAEIALIMDYDSGAVLYEKNADQPTPPGSTAKLMTAEIVFRELKEGRLHLDDMFDVSEKAWREGGAPAKGAAMFLAVKSRVRVEDLLRGLLVQSGNDAAMTLAEGISGSEAAFADLMSRRAAEIGMTNTHFADPRGKGGATERTTARDMALLAAHVIRTYRDDYRYFSEKEFTWNKIRQLNRNPIVGMEFGADGLKAADLQDGGFGEIGSAIQEGGRLIVVMYGLKSAADRIEEARKLFGYGFHSFDRRIVFAPGETVGDASVYGGQTGGVALVSDRPIVIFAPRGEDARFTAKIVYTGPLAAPVAKGADVGRLRIWREDMLIVDAPLKTGADVALGPLTRRAFDASLALAGDALRQTVGQALARFRK